MPKRPNPFGDSSPLQFKSHIGVKEIDMNNEDNMKRVYDKTRQMLFQGANKQSQVSMMECANGMGTMNFLRSDHENYAGFPKTNQSFGGFFKINDIQHSGVNGQLNGGQQNGFVGMNNNVEMNGAYAMDDSAVGNASAIQSPGNLLPGQMQLDSSGHLNGFYTKKSLGGIPAGATANPVISCHVCRQQLQQLSSRCHFCDKNLCTSCIRQCYSCNGEFCQFCSLVNYDDCFEQSFCLNCSSS